MNDYDDLRRRLETPVPASIFCAKCGYYPGTVIWCQGVLDYAHGLYQMWCERCSLDAQIAHAEQMADTLPVLRLKRAALDDSESDPAVPKRAE